MKRQIITIDEEKCVGCGLCASTCQEGAIGLVDGKAKLLREDHCDGLGNCLPGCPMEAISFIEKDLSDCSDAFQEAREEEEKPANPACECPSANAKTIRREDTNGTDRIRVETIATTAATQLNQWPVQIKLVTPNAPFFKNSRLLIAADCTAFAYGNFHNDYMKNKITVIGCPKLDDGDYSEKLTAILKANEIKSVTIVRMEVPCCGGIEQAAKNAMKESGKMIPWQVVTISTDGDVLED